MVQKTKECPLVVDIMGIVLGVIGAIVAIGLALILMWKVFTTIHDRREFARFEKERMLAKWDTVSELRSVISIFRKTLNSYELKFLKLICIHFDRFREKIQYSSKLRQRSRIQLMLENKHKKILT